MTDSKKEELLKACDRLINEVEIIADDDLDQFLTDIVHVEVVNTKEYSDY